MNQAEKQYRTSQNKIIIFQLIIPVLLAIFTFLLRYLYDTGVVDVTVVSLVTIGIVIVFIGCLIYSATLAKKLQCPYCGNHINHLGKSQSRFFSFARICPHCNQALPKNSQKD